MDRLETGVLEFVVVPDLLQAEVIRKSLEGITAVVHLASPLAVEVRHSIYSKSSDAEFTVHRQTTMRFR